jgi:hypothetical protein
MKMVLTMKQVRSPKEERCILAKDLNLETVPDGGVAFFFIPRRIISVLDPTFMEDDGLQLLYIIANEREEQQRDNLRLLVKDSLKGGVLYSDFRLRLAFLFQLPFWRYKHIHPNWEGVKIDKGHEILLANFIRHNIKIGWFEAREGMLFLEHLINIEAPYFQSPELICKQIFTMQRIGDTHSLVRICNLET